MVRGVAAGIYVPNCMDVARRWGIGAESGTVIAVGGASVFVGAGLGPFIAGMVSGWRADAISGKPERS